MLSMTEEDKKWQAESDARQIAEAAVIREDPHRYAAAQEAAKRMYAAAQEAAKRMAEEEEARQKALKKLGEGEWPLNYKESLNVRSS